MKKCQLYIFHLNFLVQFNFSNQHPRTLHQETQFPNRTQTNNNVIVM